MGRSAGRRSGSPPPWACSRASAPACSPTWSTGARTCLRNCRCTGCGGRPRVRGVGYGLIHGLLRGEILGAALVGLVIAKTVVWAVALGSGTSGGVLAPLLIIGGALGALCGQWAPGHDAGLWAAVGMAAMMG